MRSTWKKEKYLRLEERGASLFVRMLVDIRFHPQTSLTRSQLTGSTRYTRAPARFPVWFTSAVRVTAGRRAAPGFHSAFTEPFFPRQRTMGRNRSVLLCFYRAAYRRDGKLRVISVVCSEIFPPAVLTYNAPLLDLFPLCIVPWIVADCCTRLSALYSCSFS